MTEIPLSTSNTLSGVEPSAAVPSEIQRLGPCKRLELWSGRFAMMGFTATVAAIALRATP